MGKRSGVIAAVAFVAAIAAAGVTGQGQWKGAQAPFFACAAGPPATAPLHTWRELRAPHQIFPYGGAIYYSFVLANGARAHLVVVHMKSGRWQWKPAIVAAGTAPTSETAVKSTASAATNGGYFNLKESGASTSWVTIDGVTVADPRENRLLCENPKLKPFLQQIFNRTEVRFAADSKGASRILIARHNDPLPQGLRLVHALGAGPRLLPTVDALDEAFYRTASDGTVTDAINSKREAARTVFGTTADGYAMMLCISGHGQDPESSGVTLQQLADTLKSLGCTEAINFDGGASSTMYVRLGAPGLGKDDMPPAGTVVCGKNPETRVKTVLTLLPRVFQKK